MTTTVPDSVTLFRAAVRGVRRCLEIFQEKPKYTDLLCNGFLTIVDGADAENKLRQFRSCAKPLAKSVYLTAMLYALDHAKSEEEAELRVLESVNRQLSPNSSS